MLSLDLFKSDIFSMGVTLLEVAVGKKLRNINKSKSYQDELYDIVHGL